MNEVFRYFAGYVLLELSGEYPEQILNVAASHRISIWGLHRQNGKICCYTTVKSLFRLFALRHSFQARFHIIVKKGFPFFVSPYKKRYGFFIGAVLFIVTLMFLSNFIWMIDVAGNQQTAKNDILSACNEMGIRTGTPKAKIRSGIQSQKLLLACPDLSWASLNIEGSVLTVDVSERKDKNIPKNQAPCNLIAMSDGVIQKIDILNGNASVAVGDTVKKGDLLVSGVITVGEQTVFTRATGEVYATARITYCESQNFRFPETVETGEKAERKILDFFDCKIPLFVGSVKGKYSASASSSYLHFLGKKLPIGLIKADFYAVRKKERTVSEDTAEKMCMKKIKGKIKKDGIKEYEIFDRKTESAEKKLTVTLTVDTEKNIAEEDVILFAREN